MRNYEQTKAGTRPKIGVMLGTFYSDYSKSIVTEICKQLSEEKVELHLYPGADSIHYRNTSNLIDEGSGNHYFSLYGYSKFDDLDVLVISFGTISGIRESITLDEFMAGLPEAVPVILLENDTDIPNGVHITMDDYAGMKSCIEHLIHEHGCRELGYISGPINLEDSRKRLRAYQDAMRENGLRLGEERICYGNFSDQIDPIVEELLDRNPELDGIVAANDLMAESVYRVVKRRGRTVGSDIAVTGFDDLPGVRAMEPPMTTVRQDYEGLACAVRSRVADILGGRPVTSTVLPTKVVVRCSCGCRDLAREKDYGALDRILMRNWEELRDLRLKSMMTSVVFRNTMAKSVSIRYFCEQLGSQLGRVGTERAALFLIEEPVDLSGGDEGHKDKMYVPDELRMCLYLDGEGVRSWEVSEAEAYRYGELGGVFGRLGDGRVMGTFLLYCGTMQYGSLCVEMYPEQILFYYTMSLEIGSGLQHLYLALEQQRMSRELEQKNKELHFAATRDILTGLYNRSGIMARADSFVRRHSPGERFVAVMADLDHLKQINDTFGHREGDYAIRAAARIIEESLPGGSPAGRSGGDEYVCVFRLEDEAQIGQFRERMREGCERFNESSGKPYYVNLSVGCCVFSYEEADQFSTVLNAADKQLYEAKKHRRASVLRSE